MQKRLTLLLVLLAVALPLFAQRDVTGEFRTFSVRLRETLKKETTVNTPLQIKKVTVVGNDLQFVFSDNLWDYPWTPEKVTWLREEMKKNLPSGYASYTIGKIVSDDMDIEDLAFAPAGNNGVPAENKFKVRDRRNDRKPLVSKIGGTWYKRGLSGRHIALWQSHGRYFEPEENRWEWQRAPTMQTVEDLYTQSFVLPFLIPMLENAGAIVLTPRERDIQPREVICDNDPSYEGKREEGERIAGKYRESGAWEDAGPGFADAQRTYSGYDNPFKMGTVRKTKQVSGDDAPKAVWTPKIPVRGFYAVYVSYKTLSESTNAAHYTVHHLGGETEFTVNQQYGGGTWIYLGTFEFGAGTDGCVTLTADIPEGIHPRGSVVTADGVRFGGGMGKVARGIEGGELTTSGLPCYTEGALYSMQFSGIDMHLMDEWEREYTKEYASRGAWVKKMKVPFDLSLAFHSDAGVTKDDSTVGTLAIYTYKDKKTSRDPGKTTYENGEDRMNGRIFAGMVQDQIVEAVREEFDSEWNRRQLWNRNYSESRSPNVPSMILEILSHQNFADMRYGLDPTFRFTVSRGVYKGILKYLSSRYGCYYAVQPLPVKAFAADVDSTGQAVLSWEATTDKLEPTAKPKGYLLQTRLDGGAFNEGTVVETTADGKRLSTRVDIKKGHIYSFRIIAFNDGGKSFPSEILSLGISRAMGAKKILIVNNFTRVSAPSWFDGSTYAGFRNALDSGVPYLREINYIGSQYEIRRELPWVDDDNPGFGASYIDQGGKTVAGNTFDYPFIHGQSILRAGHSFVSASIAAFEAGKTPSDCLAIDLICGKQVTTKVGRGEKPVRYRVWTEKLRTRLQEASQAGCHILVSGSRVGTDAWDSVYELPADNAYRTDAQAFIRETLGWKWMTGYGTHTGTAVPYGDKPLALTVSPTWKTQPNPDCYCVENADGIVPASSAAGSFLRYGDTNISAGVWYEGASWKAVTLGFPLEAVDSRSHRDAILRSILKWFDSTRHSE